MDMRTLMNTDTDRARAELHWRITLVFTVFMMALMVVPLSVVNPRQAACCRCCQRCCCIWCSSCCKPQSSLTAGKEKLTR